LKEIRLAESAGFCFGVSRSVDMAEKLIADKGNCASLGQLIHNADAVKMLTDKGMRVINRPDEAKPGEIIEISTGNSITLEPGVFHRFFAKTGAGDLLIGEVSKINDDNTDNVFAYPQERFCAVDEDEPRYRLLVNEY